MLNVYGPQGQISPSEDEVPETIGDPACAHPRVIVVEDNSGIEGVEARQCQNCGLGWLIRIN